MPNNISSFEALIPSIFKFPDARKKGVQIPEAEHPTLILPVIQVKSVCQNDAALNLPPLCLKKTAITSRNGCLH
jgi:hypothetical protein